jgi:hypothetical protein
MNRIALVAGIVLVAASFSLVGQPVVYQYLSNFDVLNNSNSCYDDFELYFDPYDCSCFVGWFPGWGTPPTITPIPPWDTCLVRWADPVNCVKPGDKVHFGLIIDQMRQECYRPPKCIAAYWTCHGIPVQPVPIPFQFWNVGDDYVIDIVTYGPNCCVLPHRNPEYVSIDRWFTVLDEPLVLEEMMWDEIGPPKGLGWEPFLMGEILYAGSNSEDLLIHLEPGQSALVAILVRSADGEEVVRILNQAVTR